jgi:hypothetical protein
MEKMIDALQNLYFHRLNDSYTEMHLMSVLGNVNIIYRNS